LLFSFKNIALGLLKIKDNSEASADALFTFDGYRSAMIGKKCAGQSLWFDGMGICKTVNSCSIMQDVFCNTLAVLVLIVAF
jgi:hypothetical protein